LQHRSPASIDRWGGDCEGNAATRAHPVPAE
jgi:hypothetical protein